MGTHNGVKAVQVPEAVLAADKIDDKQTCDMSVYGEKGKEGLS